MLQTWSIWLLAPSSWPTLKHTKLTNNKTEMYFSRRKLACAKPEKSNIYVLSVLRLFAWLPFYKFQTPTKTGSNHSSQQPWPWTEARRKQGNKF